MSRGGGERHSRKRKQLTQVYGVVTGHGIFTEYQVGGVVILEGPFSYTVNITVKLK